jgi:hypothetical protein
VVSLLVLILEALDLDIHQIVVVLVVQEVLLAEKSTKSRIA